MHDLVKDIGEFIFVEDAPQKCNVIITVGGSFPQIAEKAAETVSDVLSVLFSRNGNSGCPRKH